MISNLFNKMCLDKHKRYKQKYGKNEMYWGIGIENEMYLEFEKKARISKDFFMFNHKRERYSVDYYTTSYKEKDLRSAFFEHSYDIKEIDIPILVNSHSFTHTDNNNEPKTTYEKVPRSNKLFNGQTLHEVLMNNPYFAKHYNVDFVYDGDTIEFITQDFYKTNVKQVISELETIKTNFINEIKPIFPFSEYGKIKFIEKNHPFAIHLTNINNVAMFNNGTYHFNFTLPTQLNEKGEIENKELFIKEHQNAIRLLQLFEPIFMVIYGTPDPFNNLSSKFSKASQRCAVSRYIGIGTYCSNKMETGKLLNIKTNDLIRNFWFNNYHKNSSYKKLEEIGVDINFNKHHYHGIEFRIFEYFPHALLEELLEFIVHLFDHSMEYETIHNIVETKQWNELMINCMHSGKNTNIPPSQMFLFNEVFGVNYRSMNIINFFNVIKLDLKKRYGNNGKCSLYMLNNGKQELNKETKTSKHNDKKLNKELDNELDIETKNCCLNLNNFIDKMSELIDNAESIQLQLQNAQELVENKVAEAQELVENKIAKAEALVENKVAEAHELVENKVAEAQELVENKIAKAEVLVENKVAEAQELVENKITKAEALVENKIAKAQELVENKIVEAQELVENKIAKAQELVENKIAKAEELVENKIAKAEALVENKVAEAEALVENKIAKAQELVENKVAEAEALVENKIAEAEALVENKVAEAEALVENKVAEAEALALKKLEETEAIVIEKISSCCIIN